MDFTTEEIMALIQYLGDMKISDVRSDAEAVELFNSLKKLKKELKIRMEF